MDDKFVCPMMRNKMYLLKRKIKTLKLMNQPNNIYLSTQIFKPTNKTLGTSVINRPMSPPFLRINAVFMQIENT